MAVGEEAQAVRDFQRRLDYNMRKVRTKKGLSPALILLYVGFQSLQEG